VGASRPDRCYTTDKEKGEKQEEDTTQNKGSAYFDVALLQSAYAFGRFIPRENGVAHILGADQQTIQRSTLSRAHNTHTSVRAGRREGNRSREE
jgi:hypothetical protein